MKKISTVGMTRLEWLKQRRKGIGGSDAAALVLQDYEYQTPYGLWLDKTGAVPVNETSSLQCRVGTYLEPFVAELFTEATGLKVRRLNAMLWNETYPFMFADIDRRIEGRDEGLECKTTSAFNDKYFKYDEDIPPEFGRYYVQMQHYMAVTGWKKWHLAVLIGNHRFRHYECKRNEEDIAEIIRKESEFWDLVRTNTNIWEN